MPEKLEAVYRIECSEDFRPKRNLPRAKAGDDDEPHHKDRAEYDADARRALELNGEQSAEKTQ